MLMTFEEDFPSLKGKRYTPVVTAEDDTKAVLVLPNPKDIYEEVTPCYHEEDIEANCLDKAKVRQIIEFERITAKRQYYETDVQLLRERFRAKELLCELLLSKLGLEE